MSGFSFPEMAQQGSRLPALTELNGLLSLSQPPADWWLGPLGLIKLREYPGSSWDGCLGDGGYCQRNIHDEEVGSCWICVLGKKSEDLDSIGQQGNHSRGSLLQANLKRMKAEESQKIQTPSSVFQGGSPRTLDRNSEGC